MVGRRGGRKRRNWTKKKNAKRWCALNLITKRNFKHDGERYIKNIKNSIM